MHFLSLLGLGPSVFYLCMALPVAFVGLRMPI